MKVAAWALIGYGAGSFPSTWVVAVLVGKRAVLDRVRRSVGEADAHVLLSEGGGRAAQIAAALDILKAFTPVIVASRLADPYAIAACAVGAVAGHCWPPYLTRYAGRGVAAGAGAFLGFLPVEMAIAGVIRVFGSLVRAGGLASTIGYVSIPVVAVLRGQPRPYVVAAIAINVLIFARRLEGLGSDLDDGTSRSRAVLRRAVLDASSARR
jgi:acyl phosphate:glycerol-3-phosphate acyltransferase